MSNFEAGDKIVSQWGTVYELLAPCELGGVDGWAVIIRYSLSNHGDCGDTDQVDFIGNYYLDQGKPFVERPNLVGRTIMVTSNQTKAMVWIVHVEEQNNSQFSGTGSCAYASIYDGTRVNAPSRLVFDYDSYMVKDDKGSVYLTRG